MEIVTLRVAAIGRVRRLALPRLPSSRRGRRARVERRPVYFPGRGWLECPCHERETLPVGARLAGAAVVEQLDTTTVILPGQRATVDGYGNLLIGGAGFPGAPLGITRRSGGLSPRVGNRGYEGVADGHRCPKLSCDPGRPRRCRAGLPVRRAAHRRASFLAGGLT